MVKTFNCSTCGGPLEYSRGTETTIRCSYCHNTVIVPDELRGILRWGAPISTDVPPTSNIPVLPSIDPMQVEKEIRDQLAAGQKINAIKIYRQATGIGLKQAKEAVEAIEAGAPIDASSFTPTENMSNTAEDEASILTQATRLVHEGKKIDAIRLLRNHFDLS